MKHTACMVWLGMAGVLCLPHVFSAQELAAVNVPILRIDVSYLMLDTKHELVGKLDEANLATDLLKKQRVLARSGTATVFRQFSFSSLSEEKAMVQLSREAVVVTARRAGQCRNAHPASRDGITNPTAATG